MGSSLSKKLSKNKKKIKQQINNYDKVKIPDNCELIKICTYNVNIRNSINLSNKTKDIISYITEPFYNKKCDIISLQGINDYKSATSIVKYLKQYQDNNNLQLYYAPNISEIDINDNINSITDNIIISSINRAIENKSSSKPSRKNSYYKKNEFQNMIISKYPILTYIYSELDNDHDIDDILGIKTIIGANVLIHNNIISVYSTELSPNIEAANLDNAFVREKELIAINDVIHNNIDDIIDIIKLKPEFNRSDLHYITGTFNITDVLNNDLNQEYINMLSNCHYLDIYRTLYNINDVPGYTNTLNNRSDYVFIYMTDDMYDEKSIFYKKLQKTTTYDDLFNLIFKRYGVYIVDIYVRTDTQDNNISCNFPIESIIMIKK